MFDLVFASTTIGLEDALADELAAFGDVVERVRGGVLLRGEVGLHEEVCLHSRIANHVLVRLGVVRREQDAERLAREASIPEFQLRKVRDGYEVSADASGEILHKRGYRQEISRAPLRETIAAAMLRLAGYTGDEPLWDPMCGSGTLAIEGAWMALRRAPGLDRPFAFMQWPTFDARAWEARVAQARAGERKTAPPIAATDLNAGAVGVARRNARRAGVQPHLRLERADVRTIQRPAGPPGLIVANLPYGIRVEADDTLLATLGRALAGLNGWRFGLLVHERAPVDQLGLRVDRRVLLDNGGIPCALLLGSIAS